MKYYVLEMCVHVLDLPAVLSLLSVLVFVRVWWFWKELDLLGLSSNFHVGYGNGYALVGYNSGFGYLLPIVTSVCHLVSGIHLKHFSLHSFC